MRRMAAGLLCLALAAGACTTEGDDEPEIVEGPDVVPATDGFQPLTEEHCAQLGLAAGAAAPLEAVAIDGWPGSPDEDWGMVVAEVIVDDADDAGDIGEAWGGATTVVTTWEPTASVLVPLHPSEDPEGGSIELRVGQADADDEMTWCDQTHRLDIEPLPPAEPGRDLAAHVDRLEDDLELVATFAGTSVAELRAGDLSDAPHELAPLVVAARLLHEPDGLPALIAAMSPQERELADRLHTQLDLLAERAELPELPVASPAAAGASDRLGLAPSVDLAAGPAVGSPLGPVTLASVLGGGHSPTAAVTPVSAGGAACTKVAFDELARLLGHQFSGATMLSSSSGAAIDGAMFVGGLPYIGRWGLPTVLTAWLVKVTSQYLESMLPSTWHRTTFENTPPELFEDDVAGGQFEGITTEFRSEGWDAGPVLAELGMIVVEQGMTSALQKYLKPIPTRGAPGTTQILGETVWESIAAKEQAEAVTDLIGEVWAWLIGSVLSDVIGQTGLATDVLTYEPRCWEGETFVPDLHPSVELRYLDAIERGGSDEHYVAATVGTGRIEASWELPIGRYLLGPVGADARSTAAPFSGTQPVEVLPLTVSLTPTRQRVEPGDVVSLNVSVEHAHDGRVRLTDSLGSLDEQIDASFGGTITYRVPSDWDGGAIEIVATSLSSTGLRAPSHPSYRGEVSATARLVAEEDGIHIEPQRSCVEPDDIVQFRAMDAPLTGDPIEARWEVDRGSIDGDGRFRAPSEPGTVTVSAVAADDPDLTASFTFEVGSCDECAWSVSIDGLLGDPTSVTASGSWIELRGVDWDAGTYTSILLLADFEEEHGPAELIGLQAPGGQPALAPNSLDVSHVLDHGSWPVTFYEDVPAVPDRQLEVVTYERLWTGAGNLPGPGIPLDVVGWEPPSLSATVRATGPDASAPAFAVQGDASGSLLVGRTFIDTVGGWPVALSEEMEAEPMFGSISVRFAGNLLPPLSHEGDVDILRNFSEGSDDPFAGIDPARRFDLDSDVAWCGGPYSRDPRLDPRSE